MTVGEGIVSNRSECRGPQEWGGGGGGGGERESLCKRGRRAVGRTNET